jgi:hypothetical protein
MQQLAATGAAALAATAVVWLSVEGDGAEGNEAGEFETLETELGKVHELLLRLALGASLR